MTAYLTFILYLGLRVIASARRIEVLEDLHALGIDTIVLDVTDPAAITAAKDKVHSLTGGKLDILVNNAYALFLVMLEQMTHFIDPCSMTQREMCGSLIYAGLCGGTEIVT